MNDLPGFIESLSLFVAAVAALVTAASLALARKHKSEAIANRARCAQIEAALGEGSIWTQAVRDARKGREAGELRALQEACAAAGSPLLVAVLDAESRIVASVGFHRLLGHSGVAGSKWTDARWISPDDLVAARAAIGRTALKPAAGAGVALLTSEGARVEGRMWSAAPRSVGELGFRLVAVALETNGNGKPVEDA